MTVTITLETMKFHAFHGVMDEERDIGGSYLADISYTVDTNAVYTDRIEDTINYGQVFDIAKTEIMKQSSLIEHVAGRISIAIKERFPQIQTLDVKITKLHPPVHGEMVSASVRIHGKFN